MSLISPLTLNSNFVVNNFKIGFCNFNCFVPKVYCTKQIDYINSYIHVDDLEKSCIEEDIHLYLTDNSELFYKLQKLQFIEKKNIKQTVRNDYHAMISYEDGELYIPLQISQNLTIKESPIVFKKKNKIEIIFNGNIHFYERYMLRYIRECLIRHEENRGSILFHSASVEINGKGILLIGLKAAGKTTLMCHFLNTEREFNFISNDRVLLSASNFLHYVPLSIRISHKTINSFKKITKYIGNGGEKLSRFNMPIEVITKNEEKLEFCPMELSKIFGKKLSTKADLSLIVVPDFNVNHSKVKLSRITDDTEKMNLLKSCCFTPHDEKWIDPWLVLRKNSSEFLEIESQNKFLDLIDKMPIYRLSYGTNVDSNDLSDLVMQVVK